MIRMRRPQPAAGVRQGQQGRAQAQNNPPPPPLERTMRRIITWAQSNRLAVWVMAISVAVCLVLLTLLLLSGSGNQKSEAAAVTGGKWLFSWEEPEEYDKDGWTGENGLPAEVIHLSPLRMEFVVTGIGGKKIFFVWDKSHNEKEGTYRQQGDMSPTGRWSMEEMRPDFMAGKYVRRGEIGWFSLKRRS